MFSPNKPKPGLPSRDLWLFVGEPKSGKTRFCMEELPNSAVIDTQRGAVKYKGNLAEVSNLDELRKAISGLVKECPYEWVVLDVLDDVYTWLEQAAVAVMAQKHGKPYTDINDIPHGAGWGEVRTKVMSFVATLRKIDANVVLVAHNKRMIDEETGDVVKVIDLPGRLAHWVPGEVDHIGIFIKAMVDDEIRYTISFKGYEKPSKKGGSVVMAGSRDAKLNGKIIPASFKELKGAYA